MIIKHFLSFRVKRGGVQNGNWSGTTGKSKGVMVTSPSITSMAHVSYSVAASCDCPLD